MRKLFFLGISLFALNTFAQAPEKMSYQAVVRNTTNNLVTNQPIGMRISLLQGSATGTAVYVETQTPTSNANGLVSLEIGGGTVVSGNMAVINWANGPYFIKTETDPTGGSSYTITGTSQLLSTPFALYAKTSGSSTPGPQGPQGIQGIQGLPGSNGTNGTNGFSSLTKTTVEPAGANCATGGVRIDVGLDDGSPTGTANNGVLEAGEIESTRYVCNGAAGTNGSDGTDGTNGTNGFTSLTKTTVEPAGANCATGGVRIDVGLDDGSPTGTANNGVLEAGEIESTRYVCNGAAGTNGTNGTNGVGVPTGGTTGQVLAKVNGTDYNTQWVTPSTGGSGPALLVRASANSAQNINFGSNTAAPDPATCFGSVTTNVGGAFNSATGVFTAPSEGLYLITIQVASSNSFAIFPYLDVDNNFVHGNTATSATDFFGVATQNTASMSSSANNRGVLSAQVYLNAGQVAGIKFQSPTTVTQPTVRTDGATNFTIVKLL